MKAKELVARTKELELELEKITKDFKANHKEFDALEDLGERALSISKQLRRNFTSTQISQLQDMLHESPIVWDDYFVDYSFTEDYCIIEWQNNYLEKDYAYIPLEWLDMKFEDLKEKLRVDLVQYRIKEEDKKRQEEEFREKKLLKALKEKYE